MDDVRPVCRLSYDHSRRRRGVGRRRREDVARRGRVVPGRGVAVGVAAGRARHPGLVLTAAASGALGAPGEPRGRLWISCVALACLLARLPETALCGALAHGRAWRARWSQEWAARSGCGACFCLKSAAPVALSIGEGFNNQSCPLKPEPFFAPRARRSIATDVWGFVAHCPRLTRRLEARKRAPRRGRDARDDPEPPNAAAATTWKRIDPLTRLRGTRPRRRPRSPRSGSRGPPAAP